MTPASAAFWALALAAGAGRAQGLRIDGGRQQGDAPSEARSTSNSSRKTGLALHFPFYHVYGDVRAEVRRLARSCRGAALSLRSVSESNVSIDVVTLRRPRGADEPPAASRAFLLAGEHARELIGSESILHLLKALCGEVGLSDGHMAEEVLKDTDFEIILNANPQARALVDQGDYCRRLNMNTVDLNRNWDSRWSEKRSKGGSGGPHPFSEPETRIVRRVLMEYKPTLFVGVHSGVRGLYMPWAYKVAQDWPKQQPMLNVLQAVDAGHCWCPYGAAGHEIGYACPGTSLDWAHEHLKAPYSFVFEIFGGDASMQWRRWKEELRETRSPLAKSQQRVDVSGKDLSESVVIEGVNRYDKEVEKHAVSTDPKMRMTCFKAFNPATSWGYHKVIENWAGALALAAKLVAQDLVSERKA